MAALIAILLLGGALAFALGKNSAHTQTTEIVTSPSTRSQSTSTDSQATSSTATSEEPARQPAPPKLRSYQGANYSVLIPSGWKQDTNELARGEEVESKWSSQTDPSDYILVDVHTATGLSGQEDAQPVHEGLEKSADYHEIAYESGDLPRHPGSWMWVFEDEGSERIDYFFETCSNTIAVLGSAFPSDFVAQRAMYREVANSFTSSCE